MNGGVAKTDLDIGTFEDRDRREDIAAEGRRGRPDRNLQRDDHADQHRVKPETGDERREDRHQHQDDHDRVDEHAADEEGDLDRDQHPDRPGLGEADRPEEHLRDLLERDDPGERRAGRNQDEHHRGDQAGRLGDVEDVAQLQ